MAKRNTRSEADEAAVKPARQQQARVRNQAVQLARPSTVEPAETVEPTEEEIRIRAYHRYLDRGGSHGAHFDDWLEAERELRDQRVHSSKSDVKNESEL